MKPGNPLDAPVAGGERYRFGDVVVDAVAHTLGRDGQAQAVEPKVFAALLVLLRHAGQLVPRDDLLDAVWGHRHVTPGVLTRAIAQLRDALGDDAQHPRYIQTQHAVGYRFIGELIPEPAELQETAAFHEASSSPETPETSVSPVAETHEASPCTGHERRGRAWRWSWPGLALLVAALGTMLWLDRRSAETEPPLPAEPSIAVLPFSNLGADRDNDYFAEGLAVEMHDALSGVQGLKVAAPVSPAFVARYQQDVKSLGRTLGVATVLDASVRREGDRVRINARLSDAGTGYTLWSHAYDRSVSDVFATQAEIADEVLGSLLQVLPQQRQALAKRLAPTRNVAAFDAYLKGLRQLLQPGSDDDNRRAIGFFNEALAADTGFARAQAGICRAEVRNFQDHNDAEAYARANTACERARKMQPGLGVVNIALAEMHLFRNEFATAIDYYGRALSDPASRPAAYVGIAIAQSRQGREAQALDYFNRALKLRPAEPTVYSQLGYHYYLAGDFPKSIEAYRKATELQPDNVDFWSYLGGVYMTAGRKDEAERALANSLAIRPNYAALTNLAELKYFAGDYLKAADLNRQAVQLDPSDFQTWGNLGQALLAVPARSSDAVDAFREAAQRAKSYLTIKPDDAKASALLGWYRANLGEVAAARDLAARAEVLGGETAEVALCNAQTFALLGDVEQSRARIATARAAGLAEYRIADNPTLRRAIAPPASGSNGAVTTIAPHGNGEHPKEK